MRRLSLLLAGTLVLFGACRTLPKPSALPEQHSLVRDQLVIHSDFTLSKQHRLIDALTRQRGHLAALLNLPETDEPIHVYLFRSDETFRQYMAEHHPELPVRRAFFVETDTRLAVYAHWGDRVAEDLRHEVAHGYLHAAVPEMPLWLDEGLAEYFEVAPGERGLNRPHVAQLLAELAAGSWRPDLARLERLQSLSEMTQLDYAESWAWVHLFLETSDERRETLRGYLAALRMVAVQPPSGEARPLPFSAELQRVEPEAGARLVEHLKSLSAGP